MKNLLEAKNARRRRRITITIATAILLILSYWTPRIWLAYINQRHASTAVTFASKGQYNAAVMEYYKCYDIPFLVLRPPLPANVMTGIEKADRRRKEELKSTLNQAKMLLSESRFKEAESSAQKALSLACTSEEKRNTNAVLATITGAEATAKHDEWLAKAQTKYVLDKNVELVKEALHCKNVASTRRLLQTLLAKKRRTPMRGHTITNSIDMELVYVPQGEFMMGSPSNETHRRSNEGPQHSVIVAEGFYMGVYEVTQAQYKAVMGKNPSKKKRVFQSKKRPVESISWHEATQFCRKLSQKEKRKYRLPTEAEWEYACRAGKITPYSTGKSIRANQANYLANKKFRDAEIGIFRPNAFGLYDMHGNVAEWCSDWYDPEYYQKSERIDPQGLRNGGERIVRGGHWWSDSQQCRSAYRESREPVYKDYAVGFRVILEVD